VNQSPAWKVIEFDGSQTEVCATEEGYAWRVSGQKTQSAVAVGAALDL